MKIIILFLLVASLNASFAATDTNILAMGEWSQPVADYSGSKIRGRLLICQSIKHRGSSGIDIAVYLELQEHSDSYGRPVEVFCDFRKGLHCELSDSSGNVAKSEFSLKFNGPAPGPFTCILQSDSSVRLRVSPIVGCREPNGDWDLLGPPFQSWYLDRNNTNAFYLSGTFKVNPTNSIVHGSSPDVWEGTLILPKMKVLIKQP